MARHLVNATELSDIDLSRLIEIYHGTVGTGGSVSSNGRFSQAHQDVRTNRERFFTLPSQAPPVPQEFTGDLPLKDRYQSRDIARAHDDMKAPFVKALGTAVAITQSGTLADQELGDRAEEIIKCWLQGLKRSGIDIQGALFDGQNLWKYGLLMPMRMALPVMPDHETLDELPADDDLDSDSVKAEKERVRERYEDTGEGYRETEASRKARHREAKLRYGFPWTVRILDPETFSFEPNLAAPGGIEFAIIVRRVAVDDYHKTVRAAGDSVLIQTDAQGFITGVATDRPADAIATGAWGREVWVAEIWTAPKEGKPGAWYELVSDGQVASAVADSRAVGGASGTTAGAKWYLVRSEYHPFRRVPIWIVKGRETMDADSARRYRSYMDDLFFLKPQYDRDIQLFKIGAEVSMFKKRIVIRDLGSQEGDTTEQGLVQIGPGGDPVYPPGWHVQELNPDIGSAFLRNIEMANEERRRLTPPVGVAENIGATTGAWRTRLEQMQGARIIMAAAEAQQQAVSGMLDEISYVMTLPAKAGGYGEAVGVLSSEEYEAGARKRRRVKEIEMEPHEWARVTWEYRIDVMMPAERLTAMAAGQEEVEKGLKTLIQYWEEDAGRQNATEQLKRVMEWNAYKQYLEPQVLAQTIAAKVGSKYVVSVDGVAIGPGGKQLTPEDALRLKGVEPIAAPQSPPQRMPSLAGSQAAPPGGGTMPLPGIAG